MISPFFRLFAVAGCAAGVMALPLDAAAQTNYYTTNGTEYAVIGSLPGDQVFPDAAISPTGGFVVWQDNFTDGDGWGISARRLDSTLSGSLSTFRVNQQGAGSQEKPRVAILKSGGAVFVWQGGKPGYQKIYARFLTPTNTFYATNDTLVNTFTNNFQINPAVAVLNNSNVVIVWASLNQVRSNSMQDVYGQLFSPKGQKIGTNFLVNQFTSFNQRTPAVTALAGGGFAVAWISEQQRAVVPATNSTMVGSSSTLNPSVDVYARLFNSNGIATGNELLVNASLNTCASPAMSAGTNGTFLIVWSDRDAAAPENSFDICGRGFTSTGVGGPVFHVNSHLVGDQYLPRVSALGLDYLVTWTSLGQDGSREGVYARFVHSDGNAVGNEFRVNTTTIGQQLQPIVAADGANQFWVAWTSFTGAPNNFDLFAQRYITAAASAVLNPLSAPFVWVPFVVSNNVYQPLLLVSWAVQDGLPVAQYEVYVDGSVMPAAVVTNNQWTMSAADNLTVNSTHSFQVDYIVAGGSRSPISPATSGTTYQGYSWGGVPYEWMYKIYGSNLKQWPAATDIIGGSGQTLSEIFLSGGNPLDSATWLRTTLTRIPNGFSLHWKTQPGGVYQVQETTDFATWSNHGSPRFAAGTEDSLNISGHSVGYYRVMLMR